MKILILLAASLFALPAFSASIDGATSADAFTCRAKCTVSYWDSYIDITGKNRKSWVSLDLKSLYGTGKTSKDALNNLKNTCKEKGAAQRGQSSSNGLSINITVNDPEYAFNTDPATEKNACSPTADYQKLESIAPDVPGSAVVTPHIAGGGAQTGSAPTNVNSAVTPSNK